MNIFSEENQIFLEQEFSDSMFVGDQDMELVDVLDDLMCEGNIFAS